MNQYLEKAKEYRWVIAIVAGMFLLAVNIYTIWTVNKYTDRIRQHEDVLSALAQGNIPSVDVNGQPTPLFGVIISEINKLKNQANPTPTPVNPFLVP